MTTNVQAHGATVSINSVDNFDQLSLAAARNLVYNTLVPACEQKGIKLSSYGNHRGSGSLVSEEKYAQQKESQELFDIVKIQQVFAVLDQVVQGTTQYKIGSYGLKHKVEPLIEGKYVTNGDCIAAMLFKGFQARFGKQTESMDVNCQFKAKIIT